MNVLYFAIIAILVGAVFRTIYAYGWKYKKDKTVSFKSTYVYSSLISMIITIVTAPTIIFSGILKFAVLGNGSEYLILFIFFSFGYLVNSILNKPVGYLISKAKPQEVITDKLKLSIRKRKQNYITGSVILLLLILLFSSMLFSYSVYQSSAHSKATVRVYGASVFSNAQLTDEINTIEWGFIAQGESKTTQLYIRNNQNYPVHLHIWGMDWIPEIAPETLILTTDYVDLKNVDPVMIAPHAVKQVALTLTQYPNGTVTDFAFNLYITTPNATQP
jgi:hypothetical protein